MNEFYLQHGYFLILLFSILPGIVVIILSSILYQQGYGYLRFFVPLFIFFTINIFSLMTWYYIMFNFPESEYHFVIYTFVGTYISSIGILVMLPLFFHKFFKVPKSQKINSILMILITTAIIYAIIEFIRTPVDQMIHLEKITNTFGRVFFLIVFALVLIYCIGLVFYYYRKLPEDKEKKIVRSSLIVTILFIPGLIHENLLPASQFSRESFTALIFIPGFYFSFSVVLCYNILRYFFHKSPISDYGSLERFIDEYDITKREAEVVRLLLNGCSNNEICDELSISNNTVKTHLKNIFQKTGARSRTDLISIIIQEK